MNASTKYNRYGLVWPDTYTDLDVELACIRMGGKGIYKGAPFGEGYYHHYRTAMSLLWPEDDWHRWAELALKSIIDNDITVLCGCSDSNKTYMMSKYALVDWWSFPENTLWLISSTEFRGAELRIWGTVKNLFNRAKDRWGDEILGGNVLEGMHAITADGISDDRSRARSLQRGLILVPCKRGKEFVGLGAFIGVKAPRLRHAGDEVSVMDRSFLDAYSNWYGKRDFKGIMSGNPLRTTDPLGIASEPLEGWDSWIDTGKTQTWRSRFFNAHVIAFDGRDSPNNDFPQDQPVKYHYLIGRKKIDAVRKTYGDNSWQFWNQCIGKPNTNMVSWQVITRQLCLEHHAREKAEWLDTKHTKVYGIDPNYGGEDRCVGVAVEFGMGLDGKQLIKFFPPDIFPVTVHKGSGSPEDQIAAFTKKRLADLDIPPENCFYDSTGKGTLGFAFARIFGSNSPIPVDSGAVPTQRPVRFDLFVQDGKEKRLKTCREHYSKFVSEMWFSVREAIEGEQVREFPEDVMDEMSLRQYEVVASNKIEIESKVDLKERIRCSPDLGDAAAQALNGARERGFKIYRLGADETEVEYENLWSEEQDQWHDAIEEALLVH